MPLEDEDRAWLRDQGVACTEHADPGHGHLLVFRDLALPAGKFTVATSDILTQLPSNFPDAPPDMFWAKPRLLLAPDGRYANATSVDGTFLGETWQRWSRHWNHQPWRIGLDDIQTVYWRIQRALKEAA